MSSRTPISSCGYFFLFPPALCLYYSSKYIFSHQNCSTCQISHWLDPSFLISAWRTQPWSRSTSRRGENREPGCWGFSFPLAPAATCPWGRFEGFLPRPSLWNPNFKFIPNVRRGKPLPTGAPCSCRVGGHGASSRWLFSSRTCQERQRGRTEVTLLSIRFKPKRD